MNKVHRIGLITAPEISGPVRINLEGKGNNQLLTWTLRRDGGSDDSLALKKLPHEGCLDAFRKLAGKSPSLIQNANILAFAKKWGVLGLDPFVREQGPPEDVWEEDEWLRYSEPVHYAEPVASYFQLASILDSLLRVNAKIRAGEWHKIQKRDIYQSPSVSEADSLGIGFRELKELWSRKADASEMYNQMENLTSYLWPPSLSLGVSGNSPNHEAYFGVSFGFWDEGCAWDRRRAKECRNWEVFRATEEQSAAPSDYPFLGVSNIVFDNLAPRSVPRARPSPLYKALLFQLMLEMLPGEGERHCSHCLKVIELNPGERKARLGKDWCRNGENGDKYGECWKKDKSRYDKSRYNPAEYQDKKTNKEKTEPV